MRVQICKIDKYIYCSDHSQYVSIPYMPGFKISWHREPEITSGTEKEKFKKNNYRKSLIRLYTITNITVLVSKFCRIVNLVDITDDIKQLWEMAKSLRALNITIDRLKFSAEYVKQ